MDYSETLPDGTILGDIPDIGPGTFFRDRQELHDKKLHRGLMRGIAPHGSSIVPSGGYIDDQDMAMSSSTPEKEGVMRVLDVRLRTNNFFWEIRRWRKTT